MENNIREIRLENEITLTELSSYTGLSAGYLSHLEKGTRENPSIKAMKTIANALDMPVCDVFNLKSLLD